jgi:hypothetical protein
MAQLPGESQQAYQQRQDAAFAAETSEERRLTQTALLADSRSVFVGVVTQTQPIDVGGVKGHQVTVRPLQSIKGDLPAQPAVVRDVVFTDCGMGGGGSATSAAPGDYVIVFAGLSPNDMRGTNVGIVAKEAQLPDLIGALAHYALVSRQAPH